MIQDNTASDSSSIHQPIDINDSSIKTPIEIPTEDPDPMVLYILLSWPRKKLVDHITLSKLEAGHAH